MDKRIEAICGDAIAELQKMENESVNLIVTDPPYNLNKDYGTSQDKLKFEDYLEFSRLWLKEAKRVLKPDGTIYIFMGMKYISYIYIILEQELGMTFNSWITWYYTQGIGKTKGFSPRHDDILMFTKNEKKQLSGFSGFNNSVRSITTGSSLYFCSISNRKSKRNIFIL
mgnify:CR=1 FL=1